MKFSGKVGNGPVNKWLNFAGDLDHRLDTGIVFRIRHHWEIRKVVSADCAARRCSAGHALAGIAIATRPMTLLRHRPTTDSHDRRALAEVCTVPVSASSLYFISLLYYLAIRPSTLQECSNKISFSCHQLLRMAGGRSYKHVTTETVGTRRIRWHAPGFF